VPFYIEYARVLTFEPFEAPARTAVSAQALFDVDVDVPSINR
jgi:hypothetical protein